MPVLKLFFDENAGIDIRGQGRRLVKILQGVLCQELDARPETCQILLCPCHGAAPCRIYVDLQFRATRARTPERLADVLWNIALRIEYLTGHVPRIRAFPIQTSDIAALG